MNLNNWDTPKLLPPTVFERTFSSSNNSVNNITASSSSSAYEHKYSLTQLVIELDKLKFEINNLKQENDSLRNKNRDYVENTQMQGDLNRLQHQSNHHQINLSTLEEIIHKQSNEIKSLKYELSNEKNSKQNNEFEMNKNFRQELDAKTRELEVLNENLKQTKQKYESCLNEEKSKVENVMRELNSLKENYEVKINGLNLNQEKLLNSKDEKIEILESNNERLLNEVRSLKHSLETIHRDNEKLSEYNALEDKFGKKCVENGVLTKEIESFKIRLNSLNEILSLQEAQLEQTNDLTRQQKKQNLLSKWRSKVFDLLVKYKSIELLCKQERSTLNVTIKDLNDRLEHQSNQNRIYETLLDDKKTQLYSTLQDNNKLNDSFNKIRQENEQFRVSNEKNLQKTLDLKKFLDNMSNNYNKIEDCFKSATKKLVSLEQRIEYAHGRLNMVKVLQTHKETHYKDELKRLMNMSENLSSIHSLETNNFLNENKAEKISTQHSSTQIVANTGDHENQLLKQELDKVLNERNMLTHKLQTDMSVMNERLSKIKEEYEYLIENLNNKVKNREDELDKREREMSKLKMDFQEKENMLNSLTTKYEKLTEQFELFKTQLELDLNKQFKMKEDSFLEKLSKMESSLNEARREQAKAIVMMRQMERGNVRDKERMEKLNKDSEYFYKSNLDRLQMKIISLEKERNLLMNTIKQSGVNLNMTEYNVLAAATATLTQQQQLISYLPPQNPPQIHHLSSTHTSNKNEMDINKWLDRNDYQLMSINQSEKANTTETTTSIWLEDSKAENNQFGINEENSNAANNTSNSKIQENNEILLQIRRIMGNLELSDIEDDDDVEDEKNYEDDDDENIVHFDVEHAIDDSQLTS